MLVNLIASIYKYSIQCKSAIYVYIYMYMCMHSFFYGTFMLASTNNLDRATNSTFLAGGSSPD